MKKARILPVIVAVCVVGLIAWRVDFGALGAVLERVDLHLATLVVILNLPLVVLAPARSHLVLRKLGHSVRPRTLVPVTLLGFVAGSFTPGASGEALRAVALRKRAGVPLEDGVALVVYERLVSFYLLGLSTALLLAVAALPGIWALIGGIGLGGLVLAPWLAAVFLVDRLPRSALITGKGVLAPALRQILKSFESVRTLLLDLRLLAIFSGITLAIFALAALQIALLARGISADLSLVDAWKAFGISQTAAIVSLLPFGIGIGDGSLATALNSFRLAFEVGAAIALLARAFMTLPLCLGALVCYLDLQRPSPVGAAQPRTEDVEAPPALAA
jgi:uncharacterized protein (TIRG00374 family)